jgi:hypothetical protein
MPLASWVGFMPTRIACSLQSARPHFSHLLRKIAQGFAPRTRREGERGQACIACDAPSRTRGGYAATPGEGMVVPLRRRATQSSAQRTSEGRKAGGCRRTLCDCRPTSIDRTPQRNAGICPRRCEKCGLSRIREAPGALGAKEPRPPAVAGRQEPGSLRCARNDVDFLLLQIPQGQERISLSPALVPH